MSGSSVGAVVDDPHGPFFTVVCTDTNPYGYWQVEFLEHTWLRSGMTGELLWLVAASEHDEIPHRRHARIARTSATNTHPRLAEPYFPLNRLYSLQEWLENERPVGTVMFIDCDMVFRAPLEGKVAPGAPVGQHWWDFGLGGRWRDAVESLSPGIGDRVQSVTWPMRIHTSDLRPLMPRWIELTVRLRSLMGAWESDMVAFAMVLAERGLHCDLEMHAAWMPWPDDVVADAPMVHFCQPVHDGEGNILWYKHEYSPWDPIQVDPEDAELGYCRDLLRMLGRYADLRRRSLVLQGD